MQNSDWISAQEGYRFAEESAKEWNPNAILLRAGPVELPGYNTIFDPDGRAPAWFFAFIDGILQPDNGDMTGLILTVCNQGILDVRLSAQIGLEIGNQPIQPAAWTVDSPEAVAIAEAGAGSAFRQIYPDAEIIAYLEARPAGPNGAVQTYWDFTYFTSARSEAMSVAIDAASGQFLPHMSLIPEWVGSVPFSEQPTLTAREGYTQAEQVARNWNPNARLISVDVEQDTIWKIDLAGRARAWVYTFLDASETPGLQEQGTYTIEVGVEGVVSSRQSEPIKLANPLGSSSNWVIDSPQVILAAESVGGGIYREKCPDSSFSASLILMSPEPGGTHPEVWMVNYWNTICGVDRMTIYLDAATGEFLPQFSWIPEWVSTPPASMPETYTAMEGLPTALSQAQSWQPSAALYKVCSGEAGLDGKASSWYYTFLPSRGTGEITTVQGLAVHLTSAGVMETSSEMITNQIQIADWSQLNMDSPWALSIAEEAGGRELRAKYPAAYVFICLELENFESESTPILWSVRYADLAGTVSRAYFIEDAGQRVQSMYNDLIDQAEKGPPISDREAFETGQRFALTWDAQARLGRLFTVFEPDQADTISTINGEAPLWGMYYITPPDDSTGGVDRVLALYISANGVEAFRCVDIVSEYEVFDEDQWTADAFQAIALAEANGGQDFRAANPGSTSVSLSLEMNSENDVQRLVWIVTYTNENGEVEFFIDAEGGVLFIP